MIDRFTDNYGEAIIIVCLRLDINDEITNQIKLDYRNKQKCMYLVPCVLLFLLPSFKIILKI